MNCISSYWLEFLYKTTKAVYKSYTYFWQNLVNIHLSLYTYLQEKYSYNIFILKYKKFVERYFYTIVQFSKKG